MADRKKLTLYVPSKFSKEGDEEVCWNHKEHWYKCNYIKPERHKCRYASLDVKSGELCCVCGCWYCKKHIGAVLFDRTCVFCHIGMNNRVGFITTSQKKVLMTRYNHPNI